MLGRLLVRTLFGFPYTTPKRWVSKERILASDLNVLSEDLDDINARFGALIPTGVIWAWGGGTTPPAGWLLCDGASYSTGVHPTLFGVIGYAYGGSGSTFYVPDTRGRLLMGAGSGPGLTARTAGAVGGVERVALALTEAPAHSHTANDHTHSGTTGDQDRTHFHGLEQHKHSFDHWHLAEVAARGWAQGSHDHYAGTGSVAEGPRATGGSVGGGGSAPVNVTGTGSGGTGVPGWAEGWHGANTGHLHGFGTGGASNRGTDSQGAGATHENMPPFVVVRAIIKA